MVRRKRSDEFSEGLSRGHVVEQLTLFPVIPYHVPKEVPKRSQRASYDPSWYNSSKSDPEGLVGHAQQ